MVSKKTSNPRHKRGRKPEHYRSISGEVINGLARRPSDGRWRVIGTGITFTERDERLAIHKYLTLYAPPKRNATLLLPVPNPNPLTRSEDLPVLASFDYSIPGECKATQHVSEPALWPWIREQILTRPQYVAQMTGIEQIGYLASLPRPVPSPTLEEVGQLYLKHAKISDNWRAKCRLFWHEFEECVDVPTLRELTQEQLVDYHDAVTDAGGTPTYARQRFGAIKAIINYPTKRGKWAEDAKRALALCAVLVPPKKSVMDPQPIGREAFHALFNSAGPQMKAMLLVALNCCLYGGEVASLSWSDVNLQKGVLNSERNKTKTVRIAVLWPETKTALQLLGSSGEAIFTTGARTPANYLSVYRLFRITRRAAGLPDVQFSHIRDGAYTAAVESGIDLNIVRLLAGHATGISDHYVKRRPQMVDAACTAVYKAYGPFTAGYRGA